MTYFATASQIFLALYGLLQIVCAFCFEEEARGYFGLVVSSLAIAALIT